MSRTIARCSGGSPRDVARPPLSLRPNVDLVSRSKVATPPVGVRSSQDFYARKAAKVARTARLLRERTTHEPEVENLSFYVARSERVAVIGPNGSGKTTLLRVLLGMENPDAGEVRFGANVSVAHFAQDTENLAPSATPLEICGTDTLPRTLLGCLKVRPDRINRPVRELSAEERVKVALVRLMVCGANLLLLDEPTNHLGVEAQEALEQALAQFPGTVLVVSHDRSFLDGLGPSAKYVELG